MSWHEVTMTYYRGLALEHLEGEVRVHNSYGQHLYTAYTDDGGEESAKHFIDTLHKTREQS